MSVTQQPELLAKPPDAAPVQTDLSAKPLKSSPEDRQSSRETPESTDMPETLAEQQSRLTEKSQWSNWTVLAMLVLCFYLIVQFRPFGSPGPQEHSGVGQRLPDLDLRPLTGTDEPVTLADLTGRVVLINFWGTWSSPSVEQLRHLAQIQEQARGNPALKVLAVSCGHGRMTSVSQLRHETEVLLEKEQIRIPTYADSGEVSRSAIESVVGLDDLPTTLILDRYGRVRSVWIGFEAGMEAEMRQLITQLLNEG
ncbi:MAG TPA: TlpA disulfide reductase family protein [Thermoguttaceae bacterium]|nr:TlpA disulfide reductase family protein [Thermoguttaceae bacterium]